jgi:hypothetical protein
MPYYAPSRPADFALPQSKFSYEDIAGRAKRFNPVGEPVFPVLVMSCFPVPQR